MKNKFLLISTIFIMQNVNYALAADAIYVAPEAPVYEETFSWDGAYIGAQAAYTFARNKLAFTGLNNDASINSNGFGGGAYAGYNWTISNAYILGIEGDVNFSNLNKYTELNVSQNNNLNWNSKIEFEGAVRARLGVSYNRLLPYIAGGVAFARSKDTFSGNPNGTAIPTTEMTATRTGFTVGAGVDYALKDNILLRAEYRYNDYGKKTTDIGNLNVERKLSTNDLRLGIAYKF